MQEQAINFEEAFKVADEAVFDKTGRHLTDIEMTIFRGSWQNLTYEEIAENTEYAANYLHRMVGQKLWERLSEALGEKVSKKNFKTALERRWREAKETASSASAQHSMKRSIAELKFPEGPVALDSPFYLERPPIESDGYQTIVQPGALIRIKAPKQMGKTSLLERIVDRTEQLGYLAVRLNLRQAERAVFNNLDKFLRWFCAYVTQKLQLPLKLNEYWNEDTGSSVSCTTYFQYHLLEQMEVPLVLALDEVDRVFEFPEIAADFFPLLRSWHEEAKTLDIWEQLRLVVVHSTEDYGRLDINHSPFNVGLPVELTEFTREQVQDLAQRHQLNWGAPLEADNSVTHLMAMVGGHPYLVRLALYHLARKDVTLQQLLKDAPTDAGIYSAHLLRHLVTLKENTELAAALKKVMTSSEPVRLETIQGYKLHSMGLIERQGDRVTPRCELYRQYFRDRLESVNC